MALMSIVDQALLWTYGVWLCEPVRRPEPGAAATGGDGHAGVGARLARLGRRFVNPAFIAILVAVVLILLGVRIPRVILTPLHTIGGMSTPMSLIYLGGMFALTKWWSVLRRYELYVGMVAKMVLFPIGLYMLLDALAAASALPVTHDMVIVVSLIGGLPTMTTIAMFAGRRDNMPEYATGFVLVSTLFSLVSLAAVSAVIL